MGKNTKGQLGVGDTFLKFSTSPILVQLEQTEQTKSILMIRCGGAHTVVLTVDGTLFTWGSGKNGATGLGK